MPAGEQMGGVFLEYGLDKAGDFKLDYTADSNKDIVLTPSLPDHLMYVHLHLVI